MKYKISLTSIFYLQCRDEKWALVPSEVSVCENNFVLTNPYTQVKSGYNHDFNRLDFAICNPELTYTVSPYQTKYKKVLKHLNNYKNQ